MKILYERCICPKGLSIMRINITFIAFTLLAGMAPSISAQEKESSRAVLEEIVVKARKREERLSDVPDTIAIFTAENIEKQRINTLTDVATLTPNVGWKHDLSPTNTFISVRGITAGRNMDPAVSVVIDGVQMSNSTQIQQELFDIQQIEVLKGPQGSLYGRNAIAGAFVITTKEPTNETKGQLEAGFGNANSTDLSGSISGPIIEDKLFFRATGKYHEDDGSILNTTLDTDADFRERKTFRGRLTWRPNNRLEVGLRYDYDDFEGGAYYYDVTREIGEPRNDPSNNFNTSPRSNPISVAHTEVKTTSITVDYDFGFATLSSVTGYDSSEERYGIPGEGVGNDGPGDLDFGPLNIQGNAETKDIDSIQQEIRLSSNDSKAKLRWVGGLFYIDIDRDDTLPVWVDLDGDNDLTGEQPFFPNGTVRNIEAYAAFGQINYDILNNLELTLGLRYDKEERDQTDLDVNNPELASQEAEFDLVQPKASLAWKIKEDNLLYLTLSRGFRSGGFNVPRSLFGAIYDQEELWSYEAGFKGTFAQGRVAFSSAIFYEDVTDKQEFVFDGGTSTQVIYNIPESEIYGIEADVSWRTTDNLTLGVSGGYMDSEIKEFKFGPLFPSPLVNEEIEGNNLPVFSHWTVNATVDYEKYLGQSGWKFFAHLDYTYRGDNYWNVINIDKENNVEVINGSFGFSNDRWKVKFWAENFTDEEYWSLWFSHDTTALDDIGHRAPERRYGITAQFQF